MLCFTSDLGVYVSDLSWQILKYIEVVGLSVYCVLNQGP